MKHQIIVIHGGDTFDSYEEYITSLKNSSIDFERLKIKGWKDNVQDDLGEEFEVIKPQMPNDCNAKYLEWKIWFDKHVPFFDPEVVLVGHSLGGIFLAKYLSENTLPKKIIATLLVAPCFDTKNAEYTLADFVLPSDLSLLERQGGQISVYHSKDDPVVPYADAAKYKKALPTAKIISFEDKGHFKQPHFPELAADIKKLFS